MSDRLIDSIIWRESKNKPNAISSRGAKYGRGLGQISEIALDDYNTIHKTTWNPDDLFKPELNREITTWQVNKRLPQLLAEQKVAPTLEALIAAYNIGAKGLARGDKPAAGYVEDILKMYKSKHYDTSRI